MSTSLDRLRQLRDQAGIGKSRPTSAIPTAHAIHEAPAARPPRVSMDDLRRLLGLRQRAMLPKVLPSLDRTLPGEEIGDGLRYVEQRHACSDAPAFVQIPDCDEPAVAGHRFLAFDTETTGLSGGTGMRAFMIGAADWVDGTVRVRQLCMTRLGAETAMLRAFAAWVDPDHVLVSYNGRSYDAPLLRTRCRLMREPDMLAERRHIDLLHPTRRRYRGVWENCRLATIERQLLGIVREDDLPGSEAPAAWLGYLRGGSSALLRRVHAHNAQDVRTLLSLLCALSTSPLCVRRAGKTSSTDPSKREGLPSRLIGTAVPDSASIVSRC